LHLFLPFSFPYEIQAFIGCAFNAPHVRIPFSGRNLVVAFMKRSGWGQRRKAGARNSEFHKILNKKIATVNSFLENGIYL